MAQYEDDQVSMAGGDDWYFDEFGEYRNANASQLEDEDIQDESMVPDEDLSDTTSPATSRVGGGIVADDEFNETLQSEHIDDQLDDQNLQREAESDYDGGPNDSMGDKIKNKFDDLTGK